MTLDSWGGGQTLRGAGSTAALRSLPTGSGSPWTISLHSTTLVAGGRRWHARHSAMSQGRSSSPAPIPCSHLSRVMTQRG